MAAVFVHKLPRDGFLHDLLHLRKITADAPVTHSLV